jgi:FkbM family methyltransferase
MIEALLPGTRPAHLASRIAQQAGFSGLLVQGENGTICGSVEDDDTLVAYASSNRWASEEVSQFREVFRNAGGTYLDIGSNIGLTVVPVAQNPAVECHAFEPSPLNAKHLRLNVAMNCPSGNVRVHEVALCDRDAEVTLELAHRVSGDNRIRTGAETGDQLNESTRTTTTVPGRRLDTIMTTTIRRPLGIKIDTQGAEPLVLEGGRNLFSHADLVSMEFWPYGLFRLGGDVDGLIDFCREHFKEGSVTEGDWDSATPQWRPMREIADLLTRYKVKREPPRPFLNVLMRP